MWGALSVGWPNGPISSTLSCLFPFLCSDVLASPAAWAWHSPCCGKSCLHFFLWCWCVLKTFFKNFQKSSSDNCLTFWKSLILHRTFTAILWDEQSFWVEELPFLFCMWRNRVWLIHSRWCNWQEELGLKPGSSDFMSTALAMMFPFTLTCSVYFRKKGFVFSPSLHAI